MQYLKVVQGDIFNATEDYIAHQCNCVSKDAKGLAQNIFQIYPHADTYSTRTQHSKPGTISIHCNVINMYAQYYPTISKYSNDTPEMRINWFISCLNSMVILKPATIAMPYNIGCCLGGGVWDLYSSTLEKFCNDHQMNITLYHKI